MSLTETQVGSNSKGPAPGASAGGPSRYQLTIVESPGILSSLIAGLREYFGPKNPLPPSKYYQGEAALPVTEMKPWWLDLPDQIKAYVAKPTEAIGIFNRRQFWRRVECGVAGSILLAIPGVYYRRTPLILLGIILGGLAGELVGALLFKYHAYPPEIWQDYQPESASWVNSLLVHAVLVLALLLPYFISRWLAPKKAAPVEAVNISPYMPELPPAANKAGGGGGGGDRSKTPASKGKIPRFSKTQLAPPTAVIPKVKPILPVPPSVLGPPQIKLPEMADNAQMGDPLSRLPTYSNGPGSGGGIGSGTGTGIGPGIGGGVGPGDTAGTGGGPFSVGGNVSAPIPIYKPEPPYSEEARKAKYQGTCVLLIVVDAQGRVTDERVIKPLGMGLDDKALETVKTWKFIPAKRNGAPVPVQVSVEVTFRLF
jgi:periplasmic protein TonB